MHDSNIPSILITLYEKVRKLFIGDFYFEQFWSWKKKSIVQRQKMKYNAEDNLAQKKY